MIPENQPSTKKDIAKLEAKFDSGFDATKKVIAELATKIDSRLNATQGDISRLDAKIDASTKRLAMEIVKTQGSVNDLETRFTKTMSQNTDRILTALDRSARIMEADNRTVTLHGSILTEVQLKLQNHDQRLARLESAPEQPAPGH